jgi:PAS domain S-box-containing protein
LIAPVTDESSKQIAYIAVKEDITEQERIAEELHESNARYRQMLDSIPILVWESDVNGVCSYVNKYHLKFTGNNLEAELGDGWLGNIHPDDEEQYEKLARRAFIDRKPLIQTYGLRRFDGEYIPVLDHGNPRYSSTGQFLGFTGVCIELNRADPCRPHSS